MDTENENETPNSCSAPTSDNIYVFNNMQSQVFIKSFEVI